LRWGRPHTRVRKWWWGRLAVRKRWVETPLVIRRLSKGRWRSKWWKSRWRRKGRWWRRLSFIKPLAFWVDFIIRYIFIIKVPQSIDALPSIPPVLFHCFHWYALHSIDFKIHGIPSFYGIWNALDCVLVNLQAVHHHSSSSAKFLVADSAFEVLRLLVLYQNLLVFKNASTIIAPRFFCFFWYNPLLFFFHRSNTSGSKLG